MPLPQGVISSTISGDVRWQAKAGIYSQLLRLNPNICFNPKIHLKERKKRTPSPETVRLCPVAQGLEQDKHCKKHFECHAMHQLSWMPSMVPPLLQT